MEKNSVESSRIRYEKAATGQDHSVNHLLKVRRNETKDPLVPKKVVRSFWKHKGCTYLMKFSEKKY